MLNQIQLIANWIKEFDTNRIDSVFDTDYHPFNSTNNYVAKNESNYQVESKNSVMISRNSKSTSSNKALSTMNVIPKGFISTEKKRRISVNAIHF